MANGGNQAPIIIKKVKKCGHGHHDGAWKVAYADFVTAMMAFFLLLWLLNATTEEQRQGIAEYFAPSSISTSRSGADGLLQGETMSSQGAMSQNRSSSAVVVGIPADPGSGEEDQAREASSETPEVADASLEELIRKREEEQFKAAEAALRQAIQSVPDLQDLAQNLLVDQTPEGLRIQIVDAEGRSMFSSGGADMLPHTRSLLELVVGAIAQLPQPITVKGHTDSTPFASRKDYTNWELSSDRAHASRRALIASGLDPARIASVVGRADHDPLIPDEPYSPRNRRISIILLRDKP